MNTLELKLRIIENDEWASAVFIFALILIAITKSVFEIRFHDFLSLISSSRYLKNNKDTHILDWFTVLLFFVQIISFSFFIFILLSYFGYSKKSNYLLFILISLTLCLFILTKYIIDSLICFTFDIRELGNQFNMNKVSYRIYIAMILLPINMILFYNDITSIFIIRLLITVILTINVLSYIISLKNYQNLIISKMYYFILYLCAFEIAPYYFIYYLFAKS